MFKMISNLLDVNQSFLSGAMDVVVVPGTAGQLKSTPFYARFGNLKILKAREKLVGVYVNGEKREIGMKLSSSGEVYFTEEIAPVEQEGNKTCIGVDKSEEVEPQQDVASEAYLKNKSAPTSPGKTQKDLSLNAEEDESIEEGNLEAKVQMHQMKINETNFTKLSRELNDSQTSRESLLKSVEISNCHNEIVKEPTKAEEVFYQKLVKKEEFLRDPWKVLNNSNVVILFRAKVYTLKSALPLLFSLLTYGEEPPQETMNKLTANKSLFSLFKKKPRDLNSIKLAQKVTEIAVQENKMKIQDSGLESSKKRTITPSSDQLNALGLREGRNELVYVVRSRLSGQQSLKVDVYLWKHDAKIVISDVDGTITKSDVLGQLMPILGKDWSHEGIADLFNDIRKNGYKFVYLTARAVCQSASTKEYINSLFQNKIALPRGPVIMNPDGLVSSFKREMIDKTPQNFKIASLTAIKNLFPAHNQPFFCGFGNRTTDAVAYRAVGIDLSRIFIVNEKGELTQLNNSYKKTYVLLKEIVHNLFPGIE